MNNQLAFEEWALDVTMAKGSGALAFVPIVGDEVYWGHTIIADRCPGTLTSVVSENGVEDAKSFAAENPNWQLDYCSADELLNATTTSEGGNYND
jgi:hypothetical protein